MKVDWPPRYDPAAAPVHVRNEIVLPLPAGRAWAKLIRAADWPRWYANSSDVVIDGGGTDLTPGATFRWRTFGVNLLSRVEEFVPGERIAWLARGTGVEAYHAWVIAPEGDGCRIPHRGDPVRPARPPRRAGHAGSHACPAPALARGLRRLT